MRNYSKQVDFNKRLVSAGDISLYISELAKNAPKSNVVFFKTGEGDYAEKDQFLGISVPMLRIIAKQVSKLELDQLQILLNSKFNEERLLALLILTNQYTSNKNEVYKFYIDNICQVNNWNLVDASAHLIVGAHLHDSDKEILFSLAKSSDLWKRRIAIVATWYFIKNNEYRTTIEIAELLLNDDHDLIHKAVGWMLREVGKKDVGILRDFLNRFASKMPRTMLRYAIEKFSEIERKTFLKR